MKSNYAELERALRLLSGHLRLLGAAPISLVVCGGAAMLACGLIRRPTQDVDICAFLDDADRLCAPVPFPDALATAAAAVAQTLALPADWLNNAASQDAAGLFQRGLPDGLQSRMIRRDYGDRVSVYFVSRFDQIHFKMLAAVNAGGRHLSDLLELRPTGAELEQAARWALSHNDSEPFWNALKSVLGQLGHDDIAARIQR